jgi:hypothetical protein
MTGFISQREPCIPVKPASVDVPPKSRRPRPGQLSDALACEIPRAATATIQRCCSPVAREHSHHNVTTEMLGHLAGGGNRWLPNARDLLNAIENKDLHNQGWEAARPQWGLLWYR